MVRVQIAPEMEFRMEVDLGDIDVSSRDYDVQQHKKEVYDAFLKRLETAFPEGFEICEFEFGLDRRSQR